MALALLPGGAGQRGRRQLSFQQRAAPSARPSRKHARVALGWVAYPRRDRRGAALGLPQRFLDVQRDGHSRPMGVNGLGDCCAVGLRARDRHQRTATVEVSSAIRFICGAPCRMQSCWRHLSTSPLCRSYGRAYRAPAADTPFLGWSPLWGSEGWCRGLLVGEGSRGGGVRRQSSPSS